MNAFDIIRERAEVEGDESRAENARAFKEVFDETVRFDSFDIDDLPCPNCGECDLEFLTHAANTSEFLSDGTPVIVHADYAICNSCGCVLAFKSKYAPVEISVELDMEED